MRFLKIIIPPLVAFGIFAILINYNPLDLSIRGMGDIGDGSRAGLIAYFKIFAPLQFVVAVLTQHLIILPLWDRILIKHKTALIVFMCIVMVCLLASSGIGYVVWDKATGIGKLTDIIIFMTGVQVLYWAINFLTLALIDWKTLQAPGKLKAETQKQEESTESQD